MTGIATRCPSCGHKVACSVVLVPGWGIYPIVNSELFLAHVECDLWALSRTLEKEARRESGTGDHL